MASEKYWLMLWLGLAVIFCSAIIGGCHILDQNDKRFIEGGYTKDMLPGCSSPVWVKK